MLCPYISTVKIPDDSPNVHVQETIVVCSVATHVSWQLEVDKAGLESHDLKNAAIY